MTGEVQDNQWPLPKFYFSVSLCDDTASFQEMAGLQTEIQPMADGQCDGPGVSSGKVPDPARVGTVTLHKGILNRGAALESWFNAIKMNTVSRRSLAISLLGERGAPKTTWTLNNAWPTKITGTDLKSEGNEVAVESVEIAYETMVIATP